MTLIVLNFAGVLLAAILSVKDLRTIGPLLRSQRSRETQSIEDRRKAIPALARLVAFVVVFVTALLMAVDRQMADARRAAAETGRDVAELETRKTLQDVHRVTRSLEEREKETQAAKEAAEAERHQREQLQRRLADRDARLRLSWTPLAGHSVDVARLKAPITITQEMVDDRKEYLLAITNPSGYLLSDASFTLQFPYPAESSELGRALGVTGLAFQPVGSRISGSSIGGGTVQVRPGGCAFSYALSMANLRPDAQLEIFVRLYSGPRIPEAHPGSIDGRYRYPVRGESATRSFYAPFEVQENNTVLMGTPRPPPRTRTISMGFANCSRP